MLSTIDRRPSPVNHTQHCVVRWCQTRHVKLWLAKRSLQNCQFTCILVDKQKFKTSDWVWNQPQNSTYVYFRCTRPYCHVHFHLLIQWCRTRTASLVKHWLAAHQQNCSFEQWRCKRVSVWHYHELERQIELLHESKAKTPWTACSMKHWQNMVPGCADL